MRVATIYRDRWYSGLSLERQGPSSESAQFGHGLLASMGITEDHYPIEEIQPGQAMRFDHTADVDAVFILPCEEVYPWVRKTFPNAKVIVWMCDDDWRFQTFGRFWMAHADVIATTSRSALLKYQAAGYKGAFLTNWAARREWGQYSSGSKLCSANFQGLLYGDRAKILTRISRDYPIASQDWRDDLLSERNYFLAMDSCRYSLCLTQSSAGVRQMKGRLFEPQILGTVLVTEDVPGLSEYWIPGEECIVFTEPEEAAEAMRVLDRDPVRREKIAAAAKSRLLKEHTFDARLRDLFAFAGVEVAVPTKGA